MGVAAGGRCFETADAAAAWVCGSTFPVASVGIDSAGAAYTVTAMCSGVTGSSLTIQRVRNGGTPQSQAVTYTGPSCDPLDYLTASPFSLSAADGGLVAAAVAGVWMAAWAWKAIYRTLGGGSENTE